VLSPHSMQSHWVEFEIRRARKREVAEKRRLLFPVRLVDYEAMHITPYGRTMTLDPRTPWSRRCIRDTQSSASCLDIPPGIWPHQWRHQ